jgi:hypothetical protein
LYTTKNNRLLSKLAEICETGFEDEPGEVVDDIQVKEVVVSEVCSI